MPMTDLTNSTDGTAFAFTAEEAIAALEAPTVIARSDRRVCKCGHPARYHASESTNPAFHSLAEQGRNKCIPGRQVCPCTEFHAVMVAQDVRRFMARTDGPGALHALAKGALSSWKMGVEVEWIPGVTCDMCQRGNIKLTPIAYTERYEESTRATPHNKLVCAECRTKLAERVSPV